MQDYICLHVCTCNTFNSWKINVCSLCVIFSLTSRLHLSSQKLIMPLHDIKILVSDSYDTQNRALEWSCGISHLPFGLSTFICFSLEVGSAISARGVFKFYLLHSAFPVVRGSGLHLCSSMQWMKLCTPTNLHMYMSE